MDPLKAKHWEKSWGWQTDRMRENRWEKNLD
jgi:hypothetical protein